MNAKIIDLSKYNSGKWYEVGFLCTEDDNENLEIVAKFRGVKEALEFADLYNKNYAGFHTIIIR